MAIDNKNIQSLDGIIQDSQAFDVDTISTQEWQELINSHSPANIDFLKNILQEMHKTSFRSMHLQKVQQLSHHEVPLFTPSKISQAIHHTHHKHDSLAIVPHQETVNFKNYQQDLTKRLTEIRLKNHFYQHATQDDMEAILGSISPTEKNEKLNEFEFWKKVQVARSSTGEKRFELLSKTLDEAPESLKPKMSEFKTQLNMSNRAEKANVAKRKKELNENTENIIQQMIEFRDKTNAWFNQYLNKLLEDPKKDKPKGSRYDMFIEMVENLKGYTSGPETITQRKKILKLSKNLSTLVEEFFKNPHEFVDPNSSLSDREKNLKIKEVLEHIKETREIFALDNEQYAIQKTQENIIQLEAEKSTATPEQISIIQDKIELQQKELIYLPIKQATRENLNPYIRLYNEFGKEPSEVDLAIVPIQIDEANREHFKRALYCFAEMGEDGKFKINNDPTVTQYYTTLPPTPDHILQLESQINKELGLESQLERNQKNEEKKSLDNTSKPNTSITDSQTLAPPKPPQQIRESRDLLKQINTPVSTSKANENKKMSEEKKGPEPTSVPSPKPSGP